MFFQALQAFPVSGKALAIKVRDRCRFRLGFNTIQQLMKQSFFAFSGFMLHFSRLSAFPDCMFFLRQMFHQLIPSPFYTHFSGTGPDFHDA